MRMQHQELSHQPVLPELIIITITVSLIELIIIIITVNHGDIQDGATDRECIGSTDQANRVTQRPANIIFLQPNRHVNFKKSPHLP